MPKTIVGWKAAATRHYENNYHRGHARYLLPWELIKKEEGGAEVWTRRGMVGPSSQGPVKLTPDMRLFVCPNLKGSGYALQKIKIG